MTAFARQLAFQADPADPRHGTDNGYANLYCRCGPCTEAHRVTHMEWRRNRRERWRANTATD